MSNIKSFGHTATEMSFEIVDDDGPTTDGRRIPTYPEAFIIKDVSKLF